MAPRRRHLAVTTILLAFLQGCGLLTSGKIVKTCEDLAQGCPGAGDGGADTAPPIDIAVDSIEPAYGLLHGGESVLVHGGPFASDVQVSFGGQPAEVRTWQEKELRVVTPAASSPGWAEVTVSTSAGSGSNAKAYRYFVDGTDKVGMVGFVELTRPQGALASMGDAGTGMVALIAPQANTSMWMQQAPDWDTCRRDYNPSLGWEPWDPGATVLTLIGRADDQIPMAWNSTMQAYNGLDGSGQVPANRILPGEIYDLSDFSGTEFPTFSIDGVVEIPRSLDVSSPDLTSTSLRLSQTSLDFKWDATAPGDGIYLTLTLFDSISGTQLEQVTCTVIDDGAFTVPPNLFSQWSAGQTLYVKVGRGLQSSATVPLNDADVGVIGAYAVVGAASTY